MYDCTARMTTQEATSFGAAEIPAVVAALARHGRDWLFVNHLTNLE